MKTISIRENFSTNPGLRHCDISDKSGEEFYHDVLNGEFKLALDRNEKLAVDLDGTTGFASSFLDEAFGNLVYDFGLDRVRASLVIVSTVEPHWKEMVEEESFEEWENRRLRKTPPKVTSKHRPWYRMNNGLLEAKVWEVPSKK